jgi:hypothetical protein
MRADDDHVHVSLFRVFDDGRGDGAACHANGRHSMQLFAIGPRQERLETVLRLLDEFGLHVPRTMRVELCRRRQHHGVHHVEQMQRATECAREVAAVLERLAGCFPKIGGDQDGVKQNHRVPLVW